MEVALSHQIKDIKSTGDFATSKSRSAFVNPGLEVDSISVPLPLTARDVEALKVACSQATFGRGDKTLFRLTNPAWPTYLHQLSRYAADKLGMITVRVEQYKLLLYEEGSFFKRHKNSEKVAGTIGTLVICLPSKHEGGDVHLSLGDKSHKFSTSTTSAFDLTALAWYSDVTHEFTNLTLSMKYMKGRDRAVCSGLDQVCKTQGFFLLLTNLPMSDAGGDSDWGNISEESLTLDYIYATSGDEISAYVHVESTDIIGPEPYSHRAPDSRSEAEFTGNASMPATHCYHDTVAMRVSKSHFHELLRHGPVEGAKSMLKMVDEDLRDHFDALTTQNYIPYFMEKMLDTSDAIGRLAWSTIASHAIGGLALSTIAHWAMKLQRYDIYRRAVSQAIYAHDWQPVIESIARYLDSQSHQTKPVEWDFWLIDFVNSSANSAELDSKLSTLGSLLTQKELLEPFQEWQLSIIKYQLSSKASFNVADRAFITKLLESRADDPQRDNLRLVSALIQRGEKHLLYILLNDLLQRDVGASEQIRLTARMVLRDAVPRLSPEINDLPKPLQPSFSTSARKAPQEEENYSLLFLRLVDYCFKNDLAHSATELVISSCTGMLNTSHLWPNSIGSLDGFLRSLYDLFQDNQQPIPPPVRNLSEALLRRYVMQAVPPHPKQLPGQAHRPRGCGNSYMYFFQRAKEDGTISAATAERSVSGLHRYRKQGSWCARRDENTRKGVSGVPGRLFSEDWRIGSSRPTISSGTCQRASRRPIVQRARDLIDRSRST
ncbi:putative Prolyl 4-hydroxylase alpha subunit Fe(2+) 2OG dioxygenase domain-containing protein [Seiridium unicorne]|uniref:Prolyl 4-hydroxylase alpha subunit Fe(2+) 2OG dioxygenase domain-containing protein n=1 Tax=Seiridium unicorne TaxID=138068 RepID=A0ABR2V6P2_9PEZI